MFLSLASCGGWMRNRHVNRPSWIALCISEWFDTAHLHWTFPLGSLMYVNKSVNQQFFIPSFILCMFILSFIHTQHNKYIINKLICYSLSWYYLLYCFDESNDSESALRKKLTWKCITVMRIGRGMHFSI